MVNEVKMQRAKEIYEAYCRMLDARNWKYERKDDKLTVVSGIRGEDLPIKFVIRINAEMEAVSYISVLPFNVPEDKRIDAAVMVCAANYGLAEGCFDYDIRDGELMFRLVNSYTGSDTNLSDDLFEEMIMLASGTVDKYNDKFLAVIKGTLSLQQFMNEEYKN